MPAGTTRRESGQYLLGASLAGWLYYTTLISSKILLQRPEYPGSQAPFSRYPNPLEESHVKKNAAMGADCKLGCGECRPSSAVNL
ncbi:hypothetical protein BN873_380018 [Candidatus Competibacter denitrificans Run_A_D11]|uniref:Uncharacterized protein n=1 Tax=Candidatus Competibacter denitrificans Run_A_D11 TaxID=1400863 RepID=W6M582_9GAMM|nr:hypothetical protein BN873_380018 [Candidatus Competibacter denitrificans Run_A_D11]